MDRVGDLVATLAIGKIDRGGPLAVRGGRIGAEGEQ